MAKETCCSSPGKVLIAGGYLVLDKPNIGLVLSTPARFYSVVKSSVTASEGQGKTVIVKSPQFDEAEWCYAITSSEAGLTIKQEGDSKKNPFVEIALAASLNLAAQMGHALSCSLEIFIVGDNDFYSQGAAAASTLPPFRKLTETLSSVSKTGLGSSAAMTTSLVAALMHHLVPSSELSKELIHNLAQYAHSLAQGKVGSGFDVSSAVHGSHEYVRFDPSCFGDFMQDSSPSTSKLLETLSPSLNPAWTSAQGPKNKPFCLPVGITMILADVKAGSNTPSMVSQVNAWRKREAEEAADLWKIIADLNVQLANTLVYLNMLYPMDKEGYMKAVEDQSSGSQASGQGSQDSYTRILFELSRITKILRSIRKHMKQMGSLASVPIEPDEQTALLDACAKLPGVLGGGVPGAGGYDALFLLVLAPESDPWRNVRRVEEFWRKYEGLQVTPLSAAAYVRGSLKSEGTQGLKSEKVEEVQGLREIIGSASS